MEVSLKERPKLVKWYIWLSTFKAGLNDEGWGREQKEASCAPGQTPSQPWWALLTPTILTTGSFTMSASVMMLGPPLKFSKIFISRLIFFFFTGWKGKSTSAKKKKDTLFQSISTCSVIHKWLTYEHLEGRKCHIHLWILLLALCQVFCRYLQTLNWKKKRFLFQRPDFCRISISIISLDVHVLKHVKHVNVLKPYKVAI